MNPYLNNNLASISPFAQGYGIPVDPDIFRYIKVSGPATTCRLIYIRMHQGELDCLFQLSSPISIPDKHIVRCLDMVSDTDYVFAAGMNTMLIGVGTLAGMDGQLACTLPIDNVHISAQPPVVGYIDIRLGVGRSTTPSILYIQTAGQIAATYAQRTLTLGYLGARPALQLCDQAAISTGYGVRSINGVQGKYLNIEGHPDAVDITHVTRDLQDDPVVYKLQISSQHPTLGCMQGEE